MLLVDILVIRNNKTPKVKLSQQREIIISYHNAVYQGQYDRRKSKREGRGIIYLPSTHHFIACSSFIDDKIWGESVFFHSHSKSTMEFEEMTCLINLNNNKESLSIMQIFYLSCWRVVLDCLSKLWMMANGRSGLKTKHILLNNFKISYISVSLRIKAKYLP